MNTMNYKGYPARIEYSEEDGCFVGHIVGINDIVGVNETTPGRSDFLQARTLSAEGHWLLHFPDKMNWRLEVFDATGRRVQVQQAHSSSFVLDLSTRASGIYSVRAISGASVATTKLLRP